MRRIAALILVFVLALSLVGCGKSDAAKNVESLISAIGEPANISAVDEGKITAAREAYDALSDKDKQAVENQSTLAEAENALIRNELSECLDCLNEYRKTCDDLYEVNTGIWKNVNSYIPGSSYGGVYIDMFIRFIKDFDDPSKTLEEYEEIFAERSKENGSPITLSLYEIAFELRECAFCVNPDAVVNTAKEKKTNPLYWGHDAEFADDDSIQETIAKCAEYSVLYSAVESDGDLLVRVKALAEKRAVQYPEIAKQLTELYDTVESYALSVLNMTEDADIDSYMDKVETCRSAIPAFTVSDLLN